MEKEIVLQALTKELRISKDNVELLANFLKENKDLGEYEFYEKLNKTFPWLELTFKYNYTLNLNRIEKHLFFFKVLAIISIVVGIIAAIAVATS